VILELILISKAKPTILPDSKFEQYFTLTDIGRSVNHHKPNHLYYVYDYLFSGFAHATDPFFRKAIEICVFE
jgi:hypothetical protein